MTLLVIGKKKNLLLIIFNRASSMMNSRGEGGSFLSTVLIVEICRMVSDESGWNKSLPYVLFK